METNAVEAKLTYLAPGSKINRRFTSPGRDINTGIYETHSVLIHDGRPIANHFTLNEHGFTLLPHKSKVSDFDDKAQINSVYLKEMEQVLLAATGADSFSPFGVPTIRSSAAKPGGTVQEPGADVHVDLSPDRVNQRAETVYQNAFPTGPGFKRFIATSFWRCLSPGPQDWPLALCECGSVSADEGTPSTLYFVDEMPDEKTRMGYIPGEEQQMAGSAFNYNPAHRWWFFSNMIPDEVVILKFYDSDHSRAWRVPHTAFFDNTQANAVTRKSIEVRSIVFFE